MGQQNKFSELAEFIEGKREYGIPKGAYNPAATQTILQSLEIASDVQELAREAFIIGYMIGANQ